MTELIFTGYVVYGLMIGVMIIFFSKIIISFFKTFTPLKQLKSRRFNNKKQI